MDKEILEILKSIQENQINMANKIENIENKLESIAEFKNEITTEVDDLVSRLKRVDLIAKRNWKDLAEIKCRNNNLVKLEDKINKTHENVIKNSENIEEVKDTVSHIEYTITRNKLDDIKLRNSERRNSEEIDSNSIIQILKRIEYKINRLDNDIISIKCKLRKLE